MASGGACECLKGIDYYGVLNLKRDSEITDIQKA